MDYREATRWFEKVLDDAVTLPSDMRKAFKLAVNACNMQTPRRAAKSNGFSEIGFCPECLNPIKTRTTYTSKKGKVDYSWCPECGQKIIWKGEEHEV